MAIFSGVSLRRHGIPMRSPQWIGTPSFSVWPMPKTSLSKHFIVRTNVQFMGALTLDPYSLVKVSISGAFQFRLIRTLIT